MTAASESRPSDPRSFGGWVFLLADALFFGAMLYIYAVARSKAQVWPDVAEAKRIGPLLPFAAAAAQLAGALLYRVRAHLLWPLLAVAGALVLTALAWRAGRAAGLAPHDGQYAFVAYGFTALWALHAAAGLAALAVQFFRGGPRKSWTILGRYLFYIAAVGFVLAGVVFAL